MAAFVPSGYYMFIEGLGNDPVDVSRTTALGVVNRRTIEEALEARFNNSYKPWIEPFGPWEYSHVSIPCDMECNAWYSGWYYKRFISLKQRNLESGKERFVLIIERETYNNLSVLFTVDISSMFEDLRREAR